MSSEVFMSYSSTISPPSSKVVCTFRRPPDTTDVLWPPARSMAGPAAAPAAPGCWPWRPGLRRARPPPRVG